jgi:uncharacterized sulfatase
MNARDDDKPFLLVGTGSETVAPGLHILRGQGSPSWPRPMRAWW